MQSNMYGMFTIVTVLVSMVVVSEGCSCMPAHPQEKFCKSHFAILARVKKQVVHNNSLIYKIRIRKHYKMTEKAEVALKSGLLRTSSFESTCGVHLKIGKVYAIFGRVESLKAVVNLCNFIEPWEKLTRRQRKGLKRMYQNGCNCTIKYCPTSRCSKTRDMCKWSTHNLKDELDCQRMQGICLRSASNNCMWAKNKQQMMCMRNLTNTISSHKKPLTISL